MGKFLNNLIVLFLKAFSHLPFPLLYLISDIAFVLLFHIIGYRKAVVYSNLRNSFPEKTEEEIDRIAREYYHHLCDVSFESIKLHSMSEEELNKRLKVYGVEKMEAYFKQQKSIIVLAMHYNNWEWGASVQRLSNHQFFMVYNPVRNNPELENFILSIRERFGGMSVPVHKSARMAIQFDQTEHPGILWLGADQTPAQSSKFWTIFLNQETPFFSGPEKIAHKTNQPVFFHHTKKVGRGKYEIILTELIVEPRHEKPETILLTYIDKMEEIIREQPAYWLWSHRRWKHQRPEDIAMIDRLPTKPKQ
ncbi:lysophospholipid acyltransferase family protein [uncultured Sunxiuqinia sp.]|uniref:lysophospholipid acyltransferase family protein n=1 Tax=uncultured Sunxiuqinia sp. TaxID=1573825 RepID=UPI00262DD077|nr:lysophospholipid acyltransferase family protein [uncultured Sunxiuqinia sp.]